MAAHTTNSASRPSAQVGRGFAVACGTPSAHRDKPELRSHQVGYAATVASQGVCPARLPVSADSTLIQASP